MNAVMAHTIVQQKIQFVKTQQARLFVCARMDTLVPDTIVQVGHTVKPI